MRQFSEITLHTLITITQQHWCAPPRCRRKKIGGASNAHCDMFAQRRKRTHVHWQGLQLCKNKISNSRCHQEAKDYHQFPICFFLCFSILVVFHGRIASFFVFQRRDVLKKQRHDIIVVVGVANLNLVPVFVQKGRSQSQQWPTKIAVRIVCFTWRRRISRYFRPTSDAAEE